MPSLLSPQQVLPLLPDFAGGTCWVAFSGGLDSSVLLHLLAGLRDQLGLGNRLKAIHINHQLSPNAESWAKHAEKICGDLQVPLVVGRVSVVNEGQGVEEAARKARYQVFERHLQSGDWLLMAHHADDQAETLMLRLLRGTGPKGLAGMPVQRALGRGQLHRPLLGFTRQVLEMYATEKELIWVDDESNGCDDYDRNYLRNRVMPLLKARWPQVSERFVDATELIAQQQQIWDEGIERLLESLLERRVWGESLEVKTLSQLDTYRRSELIRYWASSLGLDTPDATHLQELNRQLHDVKPDSELRIDWGSTSLRLSQGRLYLLRLATSDHEFLQSLTLDEDNAMIQLPHGALLSLCRSDEPDALKLQVEGSITITQRQTGDRCKPSHRRHSQTLKRLFQELNVPTWLRHQLPIIRQGDQIIAVGGLFICQGFETKGKGFKIIYTPPQAFH